MPRLAPVMNTTLPVSRPAGVELWVSVMPPLSSRAGGPGCRHRRLPQTAAFVMSAAFEVLAWNDLAAALMEDFAELAPGDRNLARKAFLRPQPDTAPYGISDEAEFRRGAVTHLR